MPTQEKYFLFIQEFILGGLILYHSFTLGQKVWPLRKLQNFGNLWKKGLFIQGVKNKFSVQHPPHVWPFLRAPAEKHILKSVLKVGYTKQNENLVF